MLEDGDTRQRKAPGARRRLRTRRSDTAAGEAAELMQIEALTGRLQAEISAHYRTHRALLESRGMLASVINSISEAVFIKDLESRYLVFNAAAERMFEVSREAVLGLKADALFAPDQARHMLSVDADVIRTREPVTYEVTGASVDASRIYLTTKAPFYDSDGEIVGIIGISKDITERKQQELAFAHQAAQLAMAQKLAHIGSWEYDLATGVVRRSEEFYRLFGVTAEEVGPTLEGFMKFMDPAAVADVRAGVSRTLATGEPYAMEYWLYPPTGGPRYVHSMAEIVCGPDGEPQRMIGTIQDITDRKRAEDALRRSEAQLAEAQRIAHFGSWIWDVPSGLIHWSAETYRMFGFAPGEFVPSLEAFWQFVHPDDVAQLRRITEQDRATNGIFEIDYRIVPRGGEVRTVHSVGEMTCGPDGAPLVMMGTIHDITERKRAEDALRLSEARLAQAQGIARVGSWELDLVSGRQVVSEGMARLFGLDPAEGPYGLRAVRDRIVAGDRQRLDAAAVALITGGAPLDIEIRIERPDGATRVIHVFAEVLRDVEGPPQVLLGTCQDITEQRQYEEALAESHREMRQLYHHLQEVQEEERGRIAREVHDEFGAVLTALHLAVHRLSNLAMPAAAETSEVIAQMRGMLAVASEAMDLIVDGLQPQMLTYLGIAATVDWYCSKFAERTKITCRCAVPGKELDVEPQLAVALFRCLQESLTNVTKHARAQCVEVELLNRDATIELTIADDGRGLDETSGSRRPNGFGIRGMKERVARLGGRVAMTPGPLGGTQVRITLPRENNSEQTRNL